MAQLLFLGFQVAQSALVGLDLDRYTLHHLQPRFLQSCQLGRIVGKKADLSNTHPLDYFSAGPVLAQIRIKAQREVGLDRILPLVLKSIGADFIDEADSSSFL